MKKIVYLQAIMDNMNENKSLYSPNKMVQELFEALRRMCNRLSV